MTARRGVLGLLFSLCVLAAAPPALAHSELLSSSPANGARLPAAPATLDLRFNEKVQVTAVRLFDTTGKEVPIVRDRSLRQDSTYHASPPALPPGSYRIEWRAISADGHPVGGTIRFQVGPT